MHWSGSLPRFHQSALYKIATLSNPNLRANLTNFKRLSKKDILNFSVPAFCQTLQDPPEPLALRLSSSLLIGVVRIYDKRLMFFEHDVQQVHNNLLKAINNTEMSSDGESINLLQHRARVDQITLDANQLHAPDNIQNLDLRLQLAEIVRRAFISLCRCF